jgi:hypothetical protein
MVCRVSSLAYTYLPQFSLFKDRHYQKTIYFSPFFIGCLIWITRPEFCTRLLVWPRVMLLFNLKPYVIVYGAVVPTQGEACSETGLFVSHKESYARKRSHIPQHFLRLSLVSISLLYKHYIHCKIVFYTINICTTYSSK